MDRALEQFSADSRWLRESGGLRLDASHYNPAVARAIETLQKSGLTLSTLGKVTARIFIPSRFKRTYVAKEHGLPFLQGSHVVHFQPADLKYVSPTVHRQLEKWVIHENWILITRSGTVGRVAITPKSWDGWAASEHLLRVIPDPESPCPPGYLYAYLSSPAGQAQLTAQIYGAVVDELTEGQARSVVVPVPVTAAQKEQVQKIHALVMQSVKKRMEAVALDEQAVAQVDVLVPSDEKPEAEDDLSAFERFQNLAQGVLSVPKDEAVEPKTRRKRLG